MCAECDKRNGTNFFEGKKAEETDTDLSTEKKEAEHEVSPESNATFTKLTPGPDGGQTDYFATPEGNVPNVPNTNN